MNKQVARQVRQIAGQIKNSGGDSRKLPCLLVTSIGNPENQYRGTRHNVGHSLLSYLCDQDKTVCGHDKFSEADIFPTAGIDGVAGLAYVRSNVYMNTSGQATTRALRWFRQNYDTSLYSPNLLIIHDDLDLAIGEVKLRQLGKAIRGHNGLRSIVATVPNEFHCLRVGIDRPDSKQSNIVAKYVLSKFTRPEQEILLTTVFPTALDLMTRLLDEIKRA